MGDMLKVREVEKVITSRSAISAEIIPFAQREMVDRFLYGVDPEYERSMMTFIKSTLEATGQAIIDGLPRVSKKNKRALHLKLEKSSEAVTKVFEERASEQVKQTFKKQIEDMVLFMPKQELAGLAEALVNITSVKRKFSAQIETVAGPIDVAVISRNDGFVWVKRKHYFDARLNPRYFFRKYGKVSEPWQEGAEQ